MKKKVIVIGGVFILVLVIILGFLQSRRAVDTIKEEPAQKTEDQTGVSRPVKTPFVKKTILVPNTPKFISSGVEINNVFKSSNATVTPEKDVIVVDKTGFQIRYLSQFDQFLITVLNPNFEAGRADAEKALIQSTGVSMEDACKLNVSISTPAYINDQYGGKTFKLSSCSVTK